MRKTFLFIALIAASVNSCDDLLGSLSSEADATLSGMSPKDSIVTQDVMRHVVDSTGEYTIDLQLPVIQTGITESEILEYASEMLGGTYEGLYTDTAAMASHYIGEVTSEYQEMAKEIPNLKEICMSLLCNNKLQKDYESSKFVTYVYTSETYSGGVHGGYTIQGQTFRKNDGRRIGWDILKNTYEQEFQELLKHGLKEYFEVGSDDELKSMLLNESDFYSIPLPQCGPMFVKEGISFVYNQYEIAPYAAGLPSFVVPYDKIKPYLNATGKKLITK